MIINITTTTSTSTNVNARSVEFGFIEYNNMLMLFFIQANRLVVEHPLHWRFVLEGSYFRSIAAAL